jgi:DNA-binding transcriptional ArsR family regulator
MRQFMNIAKALADEQRVRALLALREGELCVCQITELSGLAVSTVSKHLSVLHQAGLVESRKSGRWIHYRLPGKDAPAIVRKALAWLDASLARDPRIRQDARHRRSVLKVDPTELCKRQSRS